MSGAGVRVRTARADDGAVLAEALAFAAAWRPGTTPLPTAEVLADPSLARYVEGWPRPGDLGFVAVDGHGAPVGAAWWRFLSPEAPGFGFVAADVPELAIGVRPAWRGRGVGTSLLAALLAAADDHGLARVSLSVEPDNPARRLYERFGFERFDPAVPQGALTLVRDRHLAGGPRCAGRGR